jgi:hypothetical protein
VSRKGRTKKGDRYAQIPLEALQSEAYRWLPDFATRVLNAVAAQFNGYNNGGLELTAREARAFGIKEDVLYAGLGLLIEAGFVRRTVEARRRSGKGAPARYAITWRTLGDFPKFDIVPTVTPSRDWRRFVPAYPAVRSVAAAQSMLGQHKPRTSRLHRLRASRPRSKRVPGPLPVKTTSIARSAPGEKATFTRSGPGEVPGALPVKKIGAVH